MYQNELELIFHKLNGLEFQSFFDELMTKAVVGYYPVRQRHDGGNDGFIQDHGIFFQVFSPETITKSTITQGSSKLVSDFQKLLENWHYVIPIKKYIFVMNDKLQALDKDLIIRITEVEKAHNIKTEIYGSHRLINIFNDDLTDSQKLHIIQKYTYGPSIKTAIISASEILSKNLAIKKWELIDEKLSFNSMEEHDVELLSEIMETLFSMQFTNNDSTIINELINAIKLLINTFNSDLTRSFNGAREWDNSWKRIYPNPNAIYYDKEFKKWCKDVDNCTFKLCHTLNKFSGYIRANHKADYLAYQNYTILRRKEDSLNEYVRIIP